MDDNDPLFCGCFPTGYVYADRTREEHGDYKRLAYINYATLELDMEPNVPPELEARIRADHEHMLANVGKAVSIAGNCVVELGGDRWKLPGRTVLYGNTGEKIEVIGKYCGFHDMYEVKFKDGTIKSVSVHNLHKPEEVA